MKAAVLVEQKKPLEIADIDVPSLQYGQVLVKVHYSGICGSQLGEIDGVKGEDRYLPHLLGHEGAGVVEAVGDGVKNVSKGDHVVMHWRQGSGIEAPTPKYVWNGKEVNAGCVTTFSEYAIASENRVTKIDKDFDLKLATLFGCAITTAMGVVNNDAQVKIGDSVVIFGLGGVGLNIVQAAAMASANPIIGIDIYDQKIAMAKKFGMTHGINGKDEIAAEKIKEVLGEKGADIVIDTTGNTKVIEQAYELTHADGKTILVGVPKKGDNISIHSLPLHFKKLLKGSHGGSSDPSREIPKYINLYRSGKLKLDELITKEYSLDDINQATKDLKNGQTGRVVIRMN